MEPSTAIVTGAGKRVGRVIAEAMLERGWSVVAHVRAAGDDIPTGAVKAIADLSGPDCGERILASARELPPARLLINNAARFGWDSLAEFSADEFEAHMAVNVRAPILLTRAFAAALPEGEGLIVNILDSKLASPNPDFLSYTLSKQALAGFTAIAALALAGQGIRVNAIAPALMMPSAGQSEGNFAQMHSANPLGRGVTPTDIMAGIDYFLASGAVTGEVLTVDGGQRFWSLARDVQFLEKK